MQSIRSYNRRHQPVSQTAKWKLPDSGRPSLCSMRLRADIGPVQARVPDRKLGLLVPQCLLHPQLLDRRVPDLAGPRPRANASRSRAS
eukprot:4892448-Pyramimonas_sp.AAC.1